VMASNTTLLTTSQEIAVVELKVGRTVESTSNRLLRARSHREQ
jgi:hypothetical protein